MRTLQGIGSVWKQPQWDATLCSWRAQPAAVSTLLALVASLGVYSGAVTALLWLLSCTRVLQLQDNALIGSMPDSTTSLTALR